jgi:hypothetical protein
MEKNHTYPQVTEGDDLDDGFNSSGSTHVETEDEETQLIQSSPAYRPQPSLCIVRSFFLHPLILLMSPIRFVTKGLRMLNEGSNIPPVV